MACKYHFTYKGETHTFETEEELKNFFVENEVTLDSILEEKKEISEKKKQTLLLKQNRLLSQQRALEDSEILDLAQRKRFFFGDEAKIKTEENKLLNITQSVMKHPEVKLKTQKPLSTSEAETQADHIFSLSKQSEFPFSPISDSVQKDNLALGAAGSGTIGVYSNYVTLFGSILELRPEESLFITERYRDSKGKARSKPFEVTIAGQTFRGAVSNNKTLDGKGEISTQLEIRQNLATDNANLNVLGKVNINMVTIGVDSIMTIMGFNTAKVKTKDESLNEISIPFYFLSQPIIKELVEGLANKSNLEDGYSFNDRDTVVSDLIQKYSKKSGTPDTSAQNLYDMVASPNFNSGNFLASQVEILKEYVRLDNIAKQISTVQTAISVSSQGLGKSSIEALEKRNRIEYLAESIHGEDVSLNNLEKIVGRYVSKKSLLADEIEDHIEQGYVDMGNYLIKPTTPLGATSVLGTQLGTSVWSKFLPQNDVFVQEELERVIRVLGIRDRNNDGAIVKFSEAYFTGMKKFLFTHPHLGIYDTSLEYARNSLFYDSEGNTSLASYLLENRASNKHLKNNVLLNTFSFNIADPDTKEPSYIKIDGAEFREDPRLYRSVTELFELNTPLPPRVEGEEYTTRDLARDIIAYAFLGNPASGASMNFFKFIDLEFLLNSNFKKVVSSWVATTTPGQPSPFESLLGKTDFISEYSRQFIATETKYVPSISNRELKELPKETKVYQEGKKAKFSNLLAFAVPEHLKDGPVFVKYTDSSTDTTVLFEKRGKEYVKINTLESSYFLNNYDANPALLEQSIVNRAYEAETTTVEENEEEMPMITSENPFKIFESEVPVILRNLSEHTFTDKTFPYGEILESIVPYLDDVKSIEWLDFSEDVRFKRGKDAYAAYDNKASSIYLNSNRKEFFDLQNYPDLIPKKVLHEGLHHILNGFVDQHFLDGRVNQKAPQLAKDLDVLYGMAIDHLGKEGFVEFIDKVNKSKFNPKMGPTQEEYNKYYPVLNIKEFMVHMLEDKAFFNEMNQIKETNKTVRDAARKKTLGEKFRSLIAKILNHITGTNLFTQATLNTIFEVIEVQSKAKKPDISHLFRDPTDFSQTDPTEHDPLKPC